MSIDYFLLTQDYLSWTPLENFRKKTLTILSIDLCFLSRNRYYPVWKCYSVSATGYFSGPLFSLSISFVTTLTNTCICQSVLFKNFFSKLYDNLHQANVGGFGSLAKLLYGSHVFLKNLRYSGKPWGQNLS